tara:strand:- start:933 stop:1148 length:216 start_codon:yes stop_codon:yes gene_type:complete
MTCAIMPPIEAPTTWVASFHDVIANWQNCVRFAATYLFAAIRMHVMSVSQFSRAKSSYSAIQHLAKRFELT